MSALVLAMVSAAKATFSALVSAVATLMAQVAANANAKEEWAAVEKVVALEGRAWQILLATSYDAIQLKQRRYGRGHGPADITSHVIGCHPTQATRSGLAAITRHVMGCHSTQKRG
jgi:hypothetical protein